MPGLGGGQRDIEIERPGAGADLAVLRRDLGKAAAEPDRRRPGCRRRAPAGSSRPRSPSPGCRAAARREKRRDRRRRRGGTAPRPGRRRGTRSAGRSARSAVSRPRTGGRRSSSRRRAGSAAARSSDSLCRAAASSAGRLLAQMVIEPAPRHTTMSPGCASLAAASARAPSGPASGARVAVAVRAQPGDQRVARHAFDRRLAGRVDIGDQHHVGVVEAGAEPVEQVRRAGCSGAAARPR